MLGIFHFPGRGCCGLRRSLVRLYGQPLLLISHADGADEVLSIYFTHSGPDEDDGQRLDLQDEMSISGWVCSGGECRAGFRR